MRIGIGYDVHRFVEGRKLILGGVEIPYTKGLEGHSDADVVLHAICDALLGACSAGDIGDHFPPTDPDYKDISSVELLKRVAAVVSRNGFVINNVDTQIIAEEPKLFPYKEAMRQAVAEALSLRRDQVNIKATTAEGLGPVGRGEAIAAYAMVALREKRNEEKYNTDKHR